MKSKIYFLAAYLIFSGAALAAPRGTPVKAPVRDTDAVRLVDLNDLDRSTVKVGDSIIGAKVSTGDLINMGIIAPNSSTFSVAPRGIALIGQSNAQGYTGSTNALTETMYSGLYGGYISVSNKYSTALGDPYGWQTNLLYVLPPEPTPFHNWSVELPLGEMLQKSMGGDTYWYKSAVGGSAIEPWRNGGTYWELTTGAYEAATNKWPAAPVPEWVIYMQGESFGSHTYATYKAEQEQLISDWRNYYGNATLKVLLPGLPVYYYTKPGGSEIDRAKRDIAIADVNVFYVSMHDIYLSPSSGHYADDEMVADVAPRFHDIIMADAVGLSSAENGLSVTDLNVGTENISNFVVRVADVPEPSIIPAPVYAEALVVCRMEDDGSGIVNKVGGYALENAVGNPIAESYTVAGEYFTADADLEGIGFSNGRAISNLSNTVFFRYRRKYDINTGSPLWGYGVEMTKLAPDPQGYRIVTRNWYNDGSALMDIPVASFGFADGGYEQLTFTSHLTSNEWHSVCVTMDRATGECKGYFDGVLEVTETYSGDASSSIYTTAAGREFGFGAQYDTDPGIYCGGDISDTIIVKRVLTAEEVYSLHAGQPVYPYEQ